MGTFRVLWRDAAGEGRFADFSADNDAEASFKAAQEAESQSATFVEVTQLDG